jgi:hypothetical protein
MGGAYHKGVPQNVLEYSTVEEASLHYLYAGRREPMYPRVPPFYSHPDIQIQRKLTIRLPDVCLS